MLFRSDVAVWHRPPAKERVSKPRPKPPTFAERLALPPPDRTAPVVRADAPPDVPVDDAQLPSWARTMAKAWRWPVGRIATVCGADPDDVRGWVR